MVRCAARHGVQSGHPGAARVRRAGRSGQAVEEPLWQECLGHQHVDSTPVSSEGVVRGDKVRHPSERVERGAGGADAWPWAGAEV